MRRYALYVAVILLTFVIGYLSAKFIYLRSKVSRSAATSIQLPGEPIIKVQQDKPAKVSKLYDDLKVIAWNANGKDSRLEARLETLGKPLPHDLWDKEQYPYWSRLIIKNLTTGKVIHEERFEEFFVGMYTRDLNNDSQVELILTMTPGAVCEHITIFAVTPQQARVILNQPYRAHAKFVNGKGKLTDVLITDAELGTGPYYTTRYVWQGEGYRPAATVPYKAPSNNSSNRTRN